MPSLATCIGIIAFRGIGAVGHRAPKPEDKEKAPSVEEK